MPVKARRGRNTNFDVVKRSEDEACESTRCSDHLHSRYWCLFRWRLRGRREGIQRASASTRKTKTRRTTRTTRKTRRGSQSTQSRSPRRSFSLALVLVWQRHARSGRDAGRAPRPLHRRFPSHFLGRSSSTTAPPGENDRRCKGSGGPRTGLRCGWWSYGNALPSGRRHGEHVDRPHATLSTSRTRHRRTVT